MRARRLGHLILTAFAALSAAAAAQAQDILAGKPLDISVTVYRDPYRDEGGIDLDALEGFALITETRRVVLSPGAHTLRFEGVADGIEPASAIVTGLPSGVIEKNRDAALISPSALVESAQGQGGRVLLARTNPATGAVARSEGVIRSAADGGVVFETPDGIEALRCSGLSETFGFQSGTTGLSAVPTLSVFTRVTEPVEAMVQLSYLARGFDWAADYVANLGAGAGKLDLGAWVTLANGNGVGFENARVQIVAGRLNKETEEVEPIDIGRPILARCWPRGSTSDSPDPVYIERAYPFGFDPYRYAMARPAPAPGAAEMVVVTGARMKMVEDAALPVSVSEAEDLGDLKLYRLPGRTTVASRQSKQVRLMDRAAVPVTKIYEADLSSNSTTDSEPMTILLRTKNDAKSNLGLPLPSGRVGLFETRGSGASAQRLLSAEAGMRDLAIDEEVELRLADSADVQVRQIEESLEITGSRRRPPPLLPRMDPRSRPPVEETSRIEITNARPFAIQAEVRLWIDAGETLVSADHPVGQKNGRPIFRATVPANGTLAIRYQTTSK